MTILSLLIKVLITNFGTLTDSLTEFVFQSLDLWFLFSNAQNEIQVYSENWAGA